MLTANYKNKIIFSLKADQMNRQIRVTDEYTIDDAFSVAGKETQSIIEKIQSERFRFPRNRLLLPSIDEEKSNQLTVVTKENSFTEMTEKLKITSKNVSTLDVSALPSIDGSAVNKEASEKNVDAVLPTVECTEYINSNAAIAAQRIRLGTIEGSTDKKNWEYRDSRLANRHMLITGKSGQGKTYFIQTLLLELSKVKVDSLVIDYTDSYLPGQLDPVLEQNMAQIKQYIVVRDGLPINPFAAQQFDIGDDFHQTENISGIATRIAEVLDFVFKLGTQQKSRLITLINEGMESNSQYTFKTLKATLLDSEDSLDGKIYGRLQALLNNDPFTYDDNFDSSEYFGNKGQINIIQLSTYPSSVQNAMIEFLLWDLFNYSKSNVDQHLIYLVFLDEVQNLNFNSDSPTVKILREGRKFGFSGLFATQALSSIKGEVDAIYNAAEQVHFLPPENQIKDIAKTLSSNRASQNEFEQELSRLKKGQCIINGPSLTLNNDLVRKADIVKIDGLRERLN